MTERAGPADRGDLATRLRDAAETARALCALLHRESGFVEAGRYAELPALGAAKQTLMLSLTGCTADLEAAGWETALSLPEAAILIDSVRQLAEMIQTDTAALQRALTAADCVARLIGTLRSAGKAPGYGPGGQIEAAAGGAATLNDSV